VTNKLSDANSRSRWLPVLIVTLIVVFFFVQLSDILMPFIVGALIAYLGRPYRRSTRGAGLFSLVRAWSLFLPC
jgi:predicted PurR-regulated permease PerM